MKPQLTERFQRALVFSFQTHRTQIRKNSSIPYISHLLSVCSIVLEAGGDEDTAIASLLHDAAEDQGGSETIQVIRNEFGNRVADLVLACSDTLSDPKPDWKIRKTKHLGKLSKAGPEVLLITIADKIHNARSLYRDLDDMGNIIWDSFNGGKSGTLWYYSELDQILEKTSHKELYQEFHNLVNDIKKLSSKEPE
jgi:(p)ppGpp synthase/HD superfamily hydrolase